MTKTSAIIIVCILACGICLAHKDMTILLKEDGSLERLPKEFGSASLQVEFSANKNSSSPIDSVTLNLGNNHNRFPKCITKMLPTKRLSDIQIMGSWYHDETDLPYYLNLKFYDPDHKQAYELLFNLHNAKLMQIERSITVKDGIDFLAVDIINKCSSEELKGFGMELLKDSSDSSVRELQLFN
jgi:hypothetical protein